MVDREALQLSLPDLLIAVTRERRRDEEEVCGEEHGVASGECPGAAARRAGAAMMGHYDPPYGGAQARVLTAVGREPRVRAPSRKSFAADWREATRGARMARADHV